VFFHGRRKVKRVFSLLYKSEKIEMAAPPMPPSSLYRS
jgi:hypothetical protein